MEDKKFIINFIGNFGNGPHGEPSDESHLADVLISLGHEVRKIARDEWREYVIENYPKDKYKVPEYLKADINIICKWHHFFDGSFIESLRELSGAPVFYWCWDTCDLDIDWHAKMAASADLYLSGELGRARDFRTHGIRFYYFQMDVVKDSQQIKMTNLNDQIKYDVVYLGSCDNQAGRLDLLKEINKEIPVLVWGEKKEDWKREGFTANHAVFGVEANRIMAKSKIVLGTSGDPNLYGYWSNRIGRTLYNRSLLLQQYAPGMENFLHDWADYFSDAKEAIEKIKFYLASSQRWTARNYYDYNLFTSNQKMKDLTIFIDRYLKEDQGKEWKLP